jgi:hypothetical protein
VLREEGRKSTISVNRFFCRSWKLKFTWVSLYGMRDAAWRGRIVNGYKEGAGEKKTREGK